MKIVNRKDFLSLPNGIVYSEYESLGILNGLSVKTYSYENDWVYESLIDSIDQEDEKDPIDYLLKMEENNLNFKMDLECGERDGLYVNDQLFAIYEKEDIKKIMMKLYKVAYNYPIENI